MGACSGLSSSFPYAGAPLQTEVDEASSICFSGRTRGCPFTIQLITPNETASALVYELLRTFEHRIALQLDYDAHACGLIRRAGRRLHRAFSR